MLSLVCGVASFSTAPAGLYRGRARPRVAARCCAADLDLDQVVRQTKPVTLAYLGDAVWELEVRKRLLWPPRKLNALNSAVVTKTCAEGQHVGLHVQETLRATRLT
jgi:hypothetical protein